MTPDTSPQPADPATKPSASPASTPTPHPDLARGGDALIYVAFSRELVDQLQGGWSEPVQIMVYWSGDQWSMIARKHRCPEPAVALHACARCGQPLRDANCPDECGCADG